MFIDSFRQLDRLLRGDATRLPDLKNGTIDIPATRVAIVGSLLGVTYGLCMGAFSGLRVGTVMHQQFLASAIKVPLLFGLTLAITFPSLYVFNAMVGSKLKLVSMLRLLAAAMGVTLAVLASLGPIVAFFSLSTTSYPFMVLLNVVVFAVSGALGLTFLLQTLQRLSLAISASAQPTAPEPETGVTLVVDESSEQEVSDDDLTTPTGRLAAARRKRAAEAKQRATGALDPVEGHVLGSQVKLVFRIWLIVFGLVGAQMSWILRPFIGDPKEDFTWFRERQGSFFEGVMKSISHLFR